MAGTIVWSDTNRVTLGATGSYSQTILSVPTSLTFSGTPLIIVAAAMNFHELSTAPLSVFDPSSVLIDGTSLIAAGNFQSAATGDVSPFFGYAQMYFWRGVPMAGLAGGGTIQMNGNATTGGVFVAQATIDIVALGILYDSPVSNPSTAGTRNNVTADPQSLSNSPLTGVQVALGPAIYLGAIGATSPPGSDATWTNPADANGTWTNITSRRNSNLQVTAALFTPTVSLPSLFTNSLSNVHLGGLSQAGSLVQSVPFTTTTTARSFGIVIA